jgi:hypothetical protein
MRVSEVRAAVYVAVLPMGRNRAGRFGYRWLALDAGLELVEEPVEVGDRPRVHVGQVQRLAFLRVGDQVDYPGRGELADGVDRVLLGDEGQP